jgi:C-terminal processing protease CtpA/Prc
MFMLKAPIAKRKMTMKKLAAMLIGVVLMLAGNEIYAAGNMVAESDLWIRAVIRTAEKGPVEGIWQEGGRGFTEAGDQVIWGFFYADPEDVKWGSPQNPDVFVKIWFDHEGRLDVNFFHVSVPEIEVSSDYPYDGTPDKQGITTMDRRYIRQYYQKGTSYMDESYEDGNPPPGYHAWENPSGYFTTSDLRIGSVIDTDEKGPLEALWHKGGKDTTAHGDNVIWGYFYANPHDVAWGNVNNPELFVKIWFDASGRVDVNFFHVSVPNIEIASDFPSDGIYNNQGTTVLDNRYIRHEYWTDAPIFCSVAEQNRFVYEVMTDTYLWYDKVPDVDYTAYDSPEAMLNALKYDTLDKWSYITSTEAHYSYFEEGKYIGLGLAMDYDHNGDCRIKSVHMGSPAEEAGLKRGDKILGINGKSVEEIEAEKLWKSIMGADEIGVVVSLNIESLEGNLRDVYMMKDWVIINTVLYYDILEHNGLKTGYVVFDKFISTARDELDSVFSYFKWYGIDELVVDLRYNGGGEVSVGKYLAGLIGGEHVTGEVFAKYSHNDKYQDYDETEYFSRSGYKNALDLDRVFFITSGSTCSASELVINSLNPFMDVILIGDTTCGKPVGMYGRDFCEVRINPIEFKVTNANDQGDFFDGMEPACYATDDLTKPFGDTAEASLTESLYYIVNGVCIDN